jgi:type IV pilus assembly protein PilM
MDSAALSFHARAAGKRYEVVVAASPVEVIARYEAPFRAAGFQPGFATTSLLAALDLMPADGLNVAVKLCGRVLTVAVCDGRQPKLVRCVELDSLTMEEVMAVLFPTLAYAEDEIPQKVTGILTCGFGGAGDEFRAQCERELCLPVSPLRSVWGAPTESNAGLLGWLQAQGGNS